MCYLCLCLPLIGGIYMQRCFVFPCLVDVIASLEQYPLQLIFSIPCICLLGLLPELLRMFLLASMCIPCPLEPSWFPRSSFQVLWSMPLDLIFLLWHPRSMRRSWVCQIVLPNMILPLLVVAWLAWLQPVPWVGTIFCSHILVTSSKKILSSLFFILWLYGRLPLSLILL